MATLDQELNRLLKLARTAHTSANLPEAQKLYQQILELSAEQTAVWDLLGLTHFQAGDAQEACRCFEKARSIDPQNALAHMHCGSALVILNQPAAAAAALQQAIAIKPTLAEAHYNLGVAYQGQHQIAPARQAYLREVELRGDQAQSWNNLGLLEKSAGNLDRALECFEKAAVAEQIGAALNLAQLHFDAGRWQNAVTWSRRALDQTPTHGDAQVLLGVALDRLGDTALAAEQFRAVLAYAPHHGTALLNLANAHQSQDELDEALALYARAEPHQHSPLLHQNWHQALMSAGHYQEAEALMARAMRQFPAHAGLRVQAALCLPRIYRDTAHLESTEENYQSRLQALIRDHAAHNLNSQDLLQVLDNRNNFLLPYQDRNERPLQEAYGQLHARLVQELDPQRANLRRFPKRRPGRIRVAYCSPNFRNHSATKTTSGFLRHANRNEFEIYTYYLGARVEEQTQLFVSASEHFIHLSPTVAAVESRARIDDIDILFLADIGMTPIMSALAARRLAPVQYTTWRHPMTSGYPAIDGFVSSALMAPERAQDHYSEHLILLRNLGTSYPEFAPMAQRPQRADFGLPANRFLYVTSQSLFKYLPQFDAVYAELLQYVPHCSLVMICERYAPMTQVFKDRLRPVFESRGVDFDRRVIFVPRLRQDQFQSMHTLCDVFLDSLPWSACNSLLEVWCQTPLPAVTLPGRYLRDRHVYAMLQRLELPECVARDTDDYIGIAAHLANDPEFYRRVRERIAEHRHLLYNDKDCVRDLESAYRHALVEGADRRET